ncbi:hypothetical protein F4X86_03470 [Candidatus Saccharibacteria bacterium]|nr:hypothetical protein [Candidatus Saccharibacteria bacterium]
MWIAANSSLPISSLENVTKNDIASILVPAVFAFLLGVAISPLILRFLRKNEMWRKQDQLLDLGGQQASITAKLNDDASQRVPRMGGLVIIVTVAITTLFFWVVSLVDRSGFIHQLDYASRDAGRAETWLVIFSLITGSIIGILDDLAVVGRLAFIKGKLKEYVGGGLPLSLRLLIASIIGLVCGWWWYFQLDITSVAFPFLGSFDLGVFIIPFIILVIMATYSGGIIDGVDGLAGGTFAIMFTTYALIALLQGHFNLATFCLVVTGSILAFLWHNIPPAKFYMSETGSMALTVTLSIVAFMTDTVFLLPVIAFPLLITSLSVILQTCSKRFFGRKLFLVSPLHNYFRAKGLPGHNVVMRYWVVAQISAVSGLAIFLLGY